MKTIFLFTLGSLYICNILQKSAFKKKHIKCVHECQKQKCKFCEKEFPTDSKMKKHVESVHEGLKQYKCRQCDKAFGDDGNLKRHIKSVHEGSGYA